MSTPWFNDLFGGGRPQRRVLKGRVTTDGQGNLAFQPLAAEAHVISDEDSLDTIEPDFDAFLDCGCSVKTSRARYHCCEPGCPHVVCEQHIKYCAVCAKGTCPQCFYPYETAPGQEISLCLTHYRQLSRRQWWCRFAKAALRPLVTFEGRNSPK
jgi:hypothetical protein